MNKEILIDAIGNIDDAYIEEAHKPYRRKGLHLSLFRSPVLKPALACLAVILLIVIFPKNMKSASKDDYNGAYYSSPGMSYDGAVYESETAYTAEEAMEMMPGEFKNDSSSQILKDPNKKMILTAHLSMETQDLDETTATILQLIASYQGYVQKSSSYTRGNGSKAYEATLRIPAESYPAFLEEIKSSGNTTSYSDEIEDVTDAYTDIQSRLNSLKAQEEKVLEFYKDAATIEDLMSIESRLSDIRYEIEYYEARIKNYDLLIAYSTLYLTVYETTVYTPVNPGFFTRVRNAFTNGFLNLVNFVEDILVDVLYYFWIVLFFVLIIFIGYKIYKWIQKKRNKNDIA